MVMKKILIYSITGALFLGSISCSKFDNLNTDPNETSEVTAQLLATNLILETVSYPKVGKDFLYKDMFAKYISYMEGATSYQYNLLDRTSFYPLIKLTNVDKMIEAASGSVYEGAYTALGHFIRAYTFFNLTMEVGDIPYSEALQGEDGIYNPKYDTQKDVFLGILNELETASTLFGEARDFPGDPVYNGDVKLWQKAVNVFELKVLTHLMKKTSDADLNVVSRFNSIVSSKSLMVSNIDNFQVVYSEIEVEHYPFYNSNFRKYPIMSTTIVDKMKELQDYRLFYYAEAAIAQTKAGVSGNDWDAYVGVNPSDDFTSINASYSQNEISVINKRYYTIPQGEPTFLLSYAEQCFIISEAILRDWITGDAQLYYEDGVRAAMSFVADNTPDDSLFNHNMKITPSVIDNYLQVPGVTFSGTTDQKLQEIYQQRYFLGFMQDGWNTYYEYRRTGYPELPINELTNLNEVKTQLPKRWLYPSKELSYNRENVETAINRQYAKGDDANELMWILQ
jgi:hypothetical protein